MLVRRQFIVLFFAAMFVSASLCLAQPVTPKRTSDVFVELANSCILNVIRGHASAVVFQPEINLGVKQKLDAGLQVALFSSGIVVYESMEKKDDAVQLSYFVSSSSLSYRSLSVQGSDEKTERRFELTLFVKLIGADEKIVVAESVTRARLDTVKSSELSMLEDTRFAETKQSESKPSILESVAAPAAVIGAVGLIVFLFFSVRSR